MTATVVMNPPFLPSLFSPSYYFSIPVIYVIVVLYATKTWMKNKPVNVDPRILTVYNSLQVALSVYSFYLLCPIFTMGSGWWNIFGINADYNNSVAMGCYVTYFAKYLDLFDTLFIILKRKKDQLSVLHVTHHASVIPIWGWALSLGGAGTTQGFTPALNALIHTLIPTLQSLKIRNPFSKYLTSMQLIQFVFFMIHSVLTQSLVEDKNQQLIAFVQFFYQIYMLALFGWFFHNKYNGPKQAPSSEHTAKVE